MPFVYRLEKVLNFRIQKKDEQVEVVKKAEQEVQRIQDEINQNHNTVMTLRASMRTADPMMMESYDNYIVHLYEVIEQLEQEKEVAVQRLQEEKEKLAELEKAVKVLETHKEKMHEQYLEEEKKREMKMLDEVAGQKYFAKMKQKQEELEEAEELGLDIDEY